VDDSDLRVRPAAFAFLDEQRRLGADLLARQVLAAGFSFEGRRVPLLGPQGIFKSSPSPVPQGHPRNQAQGRLCW
jgi:putative restriction endonuclease